MNIFRGILEILEICRDNTFLKLREKQRETFPYISKINFITWMPKLDKPDTKNGPYLLLITAVKFLNINLIDLI